jgi:2-methylaconitate cis-trans-isomerase PrpF
MLLTLLLGRKVLPALMGSPDPYGRQLDGMGSGISSTSKICILSPCLDRDIADVEFTFAQIGVKDGSLDMAGNCGNMLSIVGPIAFDHGLFRGATIQTNPKTKICTAMVRILNTNTSKLVHATFRVSGTDPPAYMPRGIHQLAGVPGKHSSRVDLKFLNPGGAKTGHTLPTGHPVDTLSLPDGSTIEASLVDVSNPGVFIRGSDVGMQDPSSLDPAAVDADAALKDRLEQIRQAGASMMGLDPKTESVPKIVLVFPPDAPPSDAAQRTPRVNIRCLALSMGQAHKAVPLTLALCLGAAVRLPGTIPNQLAVGADGGSDDAIFIGHPAGVLDVKASVENGEVVSAELWRTARVLMVGEVFY